MRLKMRNFGARANYVCDLGTVFSPASWPGVEKTRMCRQMKRAIVTSGAGLIGTGIMETLLFDIKGSELSKRTFYLRPGSSMKVSLEQVLVVL
ncbi:hypothetical protein DSM25558_4724 [Agrobacterium sp. DSM 25558]|nr:hypothetical protein DSM25558_4724 [Agrobacterium sp. DSM 25558]